MKGLRSLGLDPTPEQHLQLRQHLNISPDGKVPFGEFVKATREVFRGQLKGILSPSGNFPVGSPFHQPWTGGEDNAATMRSALETSREELCLEIQRLQHLLFDKERAQKRAEDEIRRLRQEVQAMAQECQSLRTKLGTADVALQSARNMEQDYDDVIELLENEIVQLRSNHTKAEMMLSSPDQRRMAVLACQLKKAEGAKRRSDVAVEKLFDYVEQVQEVLAEVTGAAPPKASGKKAEGAAQPKPTKKQMLQALADTGQTVIKSVKAIMETVPLPYGWEKAYTDDGIAYYINHVNQTTSWSHPVTGVQHGSEGQEVPSKLPPPPHNPPYSQNSPNSQNPPKSPKPPNSHNPPISHNSNNAQH